MNIKDYISIISIERLLEDDTLPDDLREQAKQILTELFEANAIQFVQLIKGE
jgi:uncharacterized protein (UPF0147 family)